MCICIGHSLLGLEEKEPARRGFVTEEEIVGCGENSKVYRSIVAYRVFWGFFGFRAGFEWFLCIWNWSVLDHRHKCRGFSNKVQGLLLSTNSEDSQVLTLPLQHLICWLKIILAWRQIWGNTVGLSSCKTGIVLQCSCILTRKLEDFLSDDLQLFTLEINMC